MARKQGPGKAGWAVVAAVALIVAGAPLVLAHHTVVAHIGAPLAGSQHFRLAEVQFLDASQNHTNPTSTCLPAAWAWEFGDGATSSLKDPVHTYGLSTLGNVTVRLTVTGDCGASSTKVVTIQIVNNLPVADLALAAPEVEAGSPLGLDGSASSDPDGSIVAYRFFVDGVAQPDQATPTLDPVFTVAGPHTVGLRVLDNNGGISSLVQAPVQVLAGPAARLEVSPDAASLVAGGSLAFAATGFDAYDNEAAVAPDWRASCGSIGPDGLYTAPTLVQACTVTASAGDLSADASVDVLAGPLASIVVSPAEADVVVAELLGFTAAGFDEFGNDVPISPLWSADCGSIDEAGLFEAPTLVQDCTITASDQGLDGSAVAHVVPGALASIVVSPDAAEVVVAESLAFAAEGFDPYGNAIAGLGFQWSASCGSIDAGGLFEAPTLVQDCTVTASVEDVEGGAAVRMLPGALASIVLAPDAADVAAAELLAFAAEGFDQYGNSIPGLAFAWSSSCGSIGDDGVFTAPTLVQECSVTASLGDVEASVPVRVVPAALALVLVTPGDAVTNVNVAVAFAAAGFDAYGNGIEGLDFAWSSSLGSIDASGVLTPDQAGVATITASALGVQGSVQALVVDLLGVAVATEKGAYSVLDILEGVKGHVDVAFVDGSPVQGASVSIEVVHVVPILGDLRKASFTAETGSDGRAHFALPLEWGLPGTYELRVGAAWSDNSGAADGAYDVGL